MSVKKSKKVLNSSGVGLLIFVFIIALLVAIGMYKFKSTEQTSFPSPTPVSNITSEPISPVPTVDWDNMQWKSYTNADGKYSFMYPSGFDLHVNERYIFESDHKYAPVKNTIELDSNLEQSNFIFFIEHTVDSQEISLENYVNSNSMCSFITFSKGKDIIVDGVVGKFYQSTPCGVSGSSILFIMKNNIIYKMTMENKYDAVFWKAFLTHFSFSS